MQERYSSPKSAELINSDNMAPIPHITKKKPALAQEKTVSTDNVVDGLGRTLTYMQGRQKRTDRTQSENITINRQHAVQYESDESQNKLIYRDVFPGRKYKLTLSDTSWMGESNVVTIGYTVGDTFNEISSTATPPEDNVFDVEIPAVPAVDTLEIRLIGVSEKVRSYLEDNTSTSSIKAAIVNILEKIADLISGQESMRDDIEAIQRDIRGIHDDISSLDERVTKIEEELEN